MEKRFSGIWLRGRFIYCWHSQTGSIALLEILFYFDGKDIHPYVADTSKCYSAELYRKYPLSERIRNYMGGIKDGHFEAACDKDFKKCGVVVYCERYARYQL